MGSAWMNLRGPEGQGESQGQGGELNRLLDREGSRIFAENLFDLRLRRTRQRDPVGEHDPWGLRPCG